MVTFVLSHKNENVVRKSSSGGAFTAITDAWLKKHGEKAVIYGSVFNGASKAIHLRGINSNERDSMRGSKYIQSNMSSNFQQVAQDLKNRKYVLFSGTPCQISALKNYLSVLNISFINNLITVEVVCHGVASQKFFQDYIDYYEKKFHSKAIKVSFRAKHRPGKKQDMYIKFENGKEYHAPSTNYDWFYSAYLQNLVLRPSCYVCKFANPNRIADLSIADYWPTNKKGVKDESLLFVHTSNGEEILNEMLDNVEIRPAKAEKYNLNNFIRPTSKPNKYDVFWDIYKNKGFLAAQSFIGNNTVKGKIKFFIINIVYKLKLEEFLKQLSSVVRKVD